MQLTAFTDYGLRILMYLAAHRQRISSVREIAEYYGISRNHLVKVAHRLSQRGYIETIKGRGGGIKLANGTEQLRLGDLIAQLEPNMSLVECFDPAGNKCRITHQCGFQHFLREAAASFTDSLNQYRLADTVTADLTRELSG